MSLHRAAALILFLLASAIPVLSETPSRASGSWIGTLQVGSARLRIVFNVTADSAGTLWATLDSPDQGATGIPVSSAVLTGDSLKLAVLAVAGGYAGRIQAGDTVITGTWTQGGLSLPLTVRRSAQPPALSRPQLPKPPYPYHEENVSYESLAPGVRLAGTLTLPAGEGPFSAVVLVSGSGAQDRDETIFGHKPFLVIADYLTRRGFAVLRVDDRGVGGSSGSTAETTTEVFVQDVMAGVRFLNDRPDIRAERIGLLGHSEGGLVAPLAASRSNEIAFIGLLAAPGLPGDQLLLRQTADVLRSTGASEEDIRRACATNERIYAVLKEESDSATTVGEVRAILNESRAADAPNRQDSTTSEQITNRQLTMVVSPWFRFFVRYDPRPALRKVSCPVLVLHGEKDVQVAPAENQREIVRALHEGGNGAVTAAVLPRLNHLFQTAKTGAISEYGTIEETFAPAALDALGAWMDVVSR